MLHQMELHVATQNQSTRSSIIVDAPTIIKARDIALEKTTKFSQGTTWSLWEGDFMFASSWGRSGYAPSVGEATLEWKMSPMAWCLV